MAKDIKSKTRTVALNEITALTGALQESSCVDLGTSRNGHLIITVNISSELDTVKLYTSSVSDFSISVTSDAATQVVLKADAVNSKYEPTVNAAGTISELASDGTYTFAALDLSRYVKLQYASAVSDTTGTVNKINAVIVGLDMAGAPYTGDVAAYSSSAASDVWN